MRLVFAVGAGRVFSQRRYGRGLFNFGRPCARLIAGGAAQPSAVIYKLGLMIPEPSTVDLYHVSAQLTSLTCLARMRVRIVV